MLAKELSTPLRILTVNGDCGIHDLLIFQEKGKKSEKWVTLDQKPENYILIVDLGGHFVTAQPLSSKKIEKLSTSSYKKDQRKFSPHASHSDSYEVMEDFRETGLKLLDVIADLIFEEKIKNNLDKKWAEITKESIKSNTQRIGGLILQRIIELLENLKYTETYNRLLQLFVDQTNAIIEAEAESEGLKVEETYKKHETFSSKNMLVKQDLERLSDFNEHEGILFKTLEILPIFLGIKRQKLEYFETTAELIIKLLLSKKKSTDSNGIDHEDISLRSGINDTIFPLPASGTLKIPKANSNTTFTTDPSCIPFFKEKAGKFSDKEIAQYLWLNSEVLISEDMVEESQCSCYLLKRAEASNY